MKLSIIIPVYNEEDTLLKILEKIKKVNLNKIKKEIIIVDDNSTDGSKEILQKIKKPDIIIRFNKRNRGKGYCIRKAIKYTTGHLVIFQDADLEYDPEDYKKLIKPFKKGYKVVYGSRFLNKKIKGKKSFYLGNKFLSLLTSLLFLKKITDMETCYKIFSTEVLKKINLKSNDFSIEPEITTKVLKKGIKIKEIPINYYPRTVKQGKKIKIKDGFIALKTLIKYRFKN